MNQVLVDLGHGVAVGPAPRWTDDAGKGRSASGWPPGSKRRRSRWTSETRTAGVAKCQVWVAVLRLRSAIGGRGHRLRVQMRAGEGASRLGDGGCRSRIGCCAAYRSGVRMAFPQGYLVRERPLKGRGRGVNFHLAPNPYRALGEGGRSRHGSCRRCATALPAAVPQDVAAPADKRECQCELPADPIVNCPPASFSHSGVA